MSAMNCPRCGKVFYKIREPVCAACVQEENENFERVRAYVKENPNRQINEVSEECNVPVKRILMYIRDGRIDATQGMAGELTCNKCGKPIISGKMCEKCTIELNMQVLSMKKDTQENNVSLKGKIFTSQI